MLNLTAIKGVLTLKIVNILVPGQKKMHPPPGHKSDGLKLVPRPMPPDLLTTGKLFYYVAKKDFFQKSPL